MKVELFVTLLQLAQQIQLEELKNLTNELSISGMPVVDNGQLKIIVTGRDFKGNFACSIKIWILMFQQS